MTSRLLAGDTTEIPVLDVGVQPMCPSTVIDWIDDRVGESALLLNHNLHSLYIHQTSEEFRAAYAMSDATLVDGFPVLLAVNYIRLREKKGLVARDKRTGSLDWIRLLGRSRKVRRIAVLGASKNSNLHACQYIRSLDPRFVVQGWDGYDEMSLLRDSGFRDLHRFEPDLVLLGLGMPLQEEVIVKAGTEMPDAVVATVGGAIDQLSGVQKSAPRWMGRVGVEWIFRLVHDPRRLYHRYLVEPWLLARAVRRPKVRA
ncbi:WecB/TagA/CpsF family glycosyltransferase [Rhodococcus sp. BP-241]|uniref:WecB/TagA/CpsF family glycosyltransferase n=1 Tax=Rhodococcus sp. BP-241 TaxID=2739441 RepID=UPI001C9A82C1|nr:WecB/TagA/CpsF family glycosyltransferase [Rhodococcus sp. BP-241]MBY6707821.1 WecB/TagA/CpsF family glycosyltransferase [Rhodococcus sp. BP-241]